MKKTVSGYVHSILTNTGGYGIRTDAPITRLGCIEVSWDEPDPKHECGKIPGGWKILILEGRHVLSHYVTEWMGGLPYDREDKVFIISCPFCGEKLGGGK